MKIKSKYKSIRDKKRLAVYLLKLSTRGEIVKTNLRKLLKEIYEDTGEIFAKTDYGIVFQSFVIVDSDEIWFPPDAVLGCGDGFDVNTGQCASINHKPSAPILIPALIEKYPSDFNPFPGNIHTVSSILPTLKYIKGIKKNMFVKFRRDIGDSRISNAWPKSINYTRYVVQNLVNDGPGVCNGICDVIK